MIEPVIKGIQGFKTVANFALNHRGQSGKPVTRNYIYQQRDRELKNPGSTGLEFLELDGMWFVRYA